MLYHCTIENVLVTIYASQKQVTVTQNSTLGIEAQVELRDVRVEFRDARNKFQDTRNYCAKNFSFMSNKCLYT